MKNSYPVFLTVTSNCVLVEVPDFNILTEGKDIADALNMARDAIKTVNASMKNNKEAIPEPSNAYQLKPEYGTFAKLGKTTISFVDIASAVYSRL